MNVPFKSVPRQPSLQFIRKLRHFSTTKETCNYDSYVEDDVGVTRVELSVRFRVVWNWSEILRSKSVMITSPLPIGNYKKAPHR